MSVYRVARISVKIIIVGTGTVPIVSAHFRSCRWSRSFLADTATSRRRRDVVGHVTRLLDARDRGTIVERRAVESVDGRPTDGLLRRAASRAGPGRPPATKHRRRTRGEASPSRRTVAGRLVGPSSPSGTAPRRSPARLAVRPAAAAAAAARSAADR